MADEAAELVVVAARLPAEARRMCSAALRVVRDVFLVVDVAELARSGRARSRGGGGIRFGQGSAAAGGRSSALASSWQ